MTVAPNRPNDNPAARRFNASISEEHASTALPPTLFTLPNLAATDPCPEEACETSSQPAFSKQAEKPLPVANENPVEVNQSPVMPNEPAAESPVGRTESLIGNWGMRTIVIGVLLLTVVSAVFVAFNAGKDSDQPLIAKDDAEVAEEVMLEGFAVSEGVEIAQKPEEDADVNHDDVNSHVDTDIVNNTTPAGANAVLSAPLAVSPANDSPEAPAAVPSSDANSVAESTVAIGPTDLTAASPASVRSTTSTLPSEPPSADSTAGEASKAPSKTPESELDAPQPTQQPNNDEAAANNAEVAEQTSSELVLPPPEVTEKPATEPVRYSSTPLGIGDWSRYLPPPPANTTIQTSQTD